MFILEKSKHKEYFKYTKMCQVKKKELCDFKRISLKSVGITERQIVFSFRKNFLIVTVS